MIAAQQIDLIQQSLIQGTGSAPPEIYIPLWWYSGSKTQSTATSSGTAWIARGRSTTVSTANQGVLHYLSSSWPASTKFALEAAIWTFGGTTSYFALYDVTSSTIVPSSQISTTSTTATVTRSAQFTLTPGHSYAITAWNTGAQTAYITDASLIVFPS
jgi:hypothetical protein